MTEIRLQSPRVVWNIPVARSSLMVVMSVVCCGFLGCGPAAKPGGSVTGKVTLNGKPVTDGLVVFNSSSKGVAAESKLDSTGSFKLTDSLPVGDYVVTVKPPPAPAPLGPAASTPPPKSDIPEKYRSEAKSGLTFPIKAGANTATFELKP